MGGVLGSSWRFKEHRQNRAVSQLTYFPPVPLFGIEEEALRVLKERRDGVMMSSAAGFHPDTQRA